MKHQPLANVHFRLSPESTIQKKHVTPSELMFLIAMHKQNAKGAPVARLQIVPDDTEEKRIAELRSKIKNYENAISRLQEDVQKGKMTIDVGDAREVGLIRQITSTESLIEEQQRLLTIRSLNPVQERTRLCSIYNGREVKAFFPGGIPTLPKTFDEATANGVEAEYTPTVGETFYAGRDKLAEIEKGVHA